MTPDIARVRSRRPTDLALESQPGFDETATAFQSLAQVVYGGHSFDDLYQTLCDTAVRIVPGCDHASLMLRKGNHIFAGAASDDVAARVDELELELGEGPCVDALVDEVAHIAPDLTATPAWPRLTARVLAETPVRGAAGFRVVIDGRKLGSLNILCDTPDLLDDSSLNQAALLAAFASVGLQAASQRETAESLLKGLHNNREIGKAVGLMMAFHKLDDADAFELLRKSSQDLNLKVVDIARDLVEHHNRGALPRVQEA